MWPRNLLFLGLVGALLALGASFLPPRQPAPRTGYDAAAYDDAGFRAAVAAVDASFRRTWKEKELTPAGPAADLTVMRRLALALMGTVPSLEEVRQFEHLPPDARLPWWLDTILADRRSADYLAERLARAYVGTEDGPFILYRRRRFVTWLADELANNTPYDHLVRQLIAGDGLWTDQPSTNFISVTSKPDSKNQPDPVRLAGRVTRAFLGLRLDCAECHNHPYAKWKQADFQGLAAFFGQTKVGFTGIHDGDGELELGTKRAPDEKRVVAPRVPFSQNLLPEDGNRRERLAAWVTHRDSPYFARAAVNRTWALMFGRPLADPVDNLETEGFVPPALKLLADDFTAHDFDLRRLVRVIAFTEAFRLDSKAARDPTEEDEAGWAAFPLTRLRPEQVAGAALQASSVHTINAESHILTRLVRAGSENDFVKRYGDSGEDEFGGRGGTITQRLLLMNGKLIRERIKQGLFNASTRIAWLAPDDPRAVEAAYLAVLTRRPTPEESEHFEQALADTALGRPQRLEDLYWALINATEFSWNH